MALTFYSGKTLHKVTTPRRLKHALRTGKLLSGKNSAYTVEEQAAACYLLPCAPCSNLINLNSPLFPTLDSTINTSQDLADESQITESSQITTKSQSINKSQITTDMQPKSSALNLTASSNLPTESFVQHNMRKNAWHVVTQEAGQNAEPNVRQDAQQDADYFLNQNVSHILIQNERQELKQEAPLLESNHELFPNSNSQQLNKAQLSRIATNLSTAKHSTNFSYLWYVPCRPKISFSTKASLQSYVASDHADLSLCDVSKLYDLSGVFYQSTRQNWEGIEEWQTSQVVNFAHMFDGAACFQASLELWDMRSAQDLTMMFANCPVFNTSLQHWQTGNVRSMAGMFYKATAFSGEIGAWNTRNVVYMQHMFHDALSFDDCLYHWDTHKVRNFAYMFCNAQSFTNRLNSLSGWNMKSAKDLRGMLSGLSEQCKLDLSYMFLSDEAQIQGILADSHAMVKGWEHLYKIAQHTRQDLFETGSM